MKKTIKYLILNVIISALAIFCIMTFGFKAPLAYDDGQVGTQSFLLSPKGDLSVDYIDGVVTKGSFVRVQNGKEYQLVLGYDGENIDYEDFTFNSDLEDVSFNLNYDWNEEVFYMGRTLTYIKGINTFSLVSMVVLAVQVLFYISFVLNLKSSDEESEHLFKETLYRRIMRVPVIAFSSIVAVVGIIFFASIFFDLEYYLYEMSDTILLLGAGAIILVVLGWSAYIAIFVQNYVFEFSNERLIVNHKLKEIFNSPFENLIIEERLTQSSGYTNNFTNMTLILKSKDVRTRAVEMNLVFLGSKQYNALVEKLHSLAKGRETSVEEFEANGYSDEFIAKKGGPKVVVRAIAAVFLIITLIVVGIVFAELSTSWVMIAMIVAALIVVVVILIAFVLPKNKAIKIRADLGGIHINDDFYEASTIKKITMTRPLAGSNVLCNITLKHQSGTLHYMLPMDYKHQNFSENYRELYRTINQHYKDVLH